MGDAEQSIANAKSGFIVTGSVVFNNAGLADTTITIANDTKEIVVTSDETGRFVAKDIPVGTYTVHAKHAGYTFEPYTKELVITEMPKEDIVFSALTAYAVRGTVAGDVIEDVTVSVKNDQYERTTTTDARGYFSLPDVPAGTFTVTVSKDSRLFCPGEKTIEVTDRNIEGLLFTNGFISFDQTLGDAYQDVITSSIITHDGALVIAGYTSSVQKKEDAYIAKLNGQGDIMWQQSIGGTLDDRALAVVEDSDGSIVIAGETTSFGSGGSDIWVVKLDPEGNYIWDKTFGSTGSEKGRSIAVTSQGYVIAGRQFAPGATDSNAYVVHSDTSGNLLWERSYGGSRHDDAYAVVQTHDSNIVLAGYTNLHVNGENDAWVLKIEPGQGDIIWNKRYGGDGSDEFYAMTVLSDGSFILAGSTTTESKGGTDVYAVKLDSSGNPVWENSFGTTVSEKASAVAVLPGGSLVFAGSRTLGPTNTDALLLHSDQNGGMISETLFGDTVFDAFHSVIATPAGTIITSGEKTGQSSDMWLTSFELTVEGTK